MGLLLSKPREPLAKHTSSGPAPLIRYATLGGAQLFVGAAAIFARLALGGAGPLAVACLRLGIAAAVVGALLLARGGEARARLGARREALLALAGVALAIHFAGWIASLQFTSVAIATLLVCTSPIFTGIYDAIALRRPPGVTLGLALLCGAAGLWLVVAAHGAPAPVAGRTVLGALLAIAGAAAMAAYLTLVRTIRRRLPTLAVVARTYTWAAIVLVPLALATHEKPPPPGAHAAWFGILAMALISQLLGHTAMNAALRWFTPTTIGFSTLFEPLIAAILAAIVFGEAIGGTALIGAALLFAAIALAIRDQAAVVQATEL
jgi:drug/metabolite transporter (DMT)-like permease